MNLKHSVLRRAWKANCCFKWKRKLTKKNEGNYVKVQTDGRLRESPSEVTLIEAQTRRGSGICIRLEVFRSAQSAATRLNCVQSLNRAETRELMLLNYARREIHQQYKFPWKSERKLFHLHAEWVNRKKWHKNLVFHMSFPDAFAPVYHPTLSQTYFNLHSLLHLPNMIRPNSTHSWCINRSLTQLVSLRHRNVIFSSLRVS